MTFREVRSLLRGVGVAWSADRPLSSSQTFCRRASQSSVVLRTPTAGAGKRPPMQEDSFQSSRTCS